MRNAFVVEGKVLKLMQVLGAALTCKVLQLMSGMATAPVAVRNLWTSTLHVTILHSLRSKRDFAMEFKSYMSSDIFSITA